MTEKGDEKNAGQKRGSQKRFNTEWLSKEEIDRLVQGVDDHYFGGLGQREDQKKPSQEESADESVKHEEDGE